MGFGNRTSIPESGNSHFTNTSYGGVSPCIVPKGIDSQGREYDYTLGTGSTLRNCVGYAGGRGSEMGCGSDATSLGMHNAPSYVFYHYSGSMTSTPNLGSAVYWWNGRFDTNYGHVAIVEEINGNNVKISESGFSEDSSHNGNYSGGISLDNLRNHVNFTATYFGFMPFPGEPGPGPGPGPTPSGHFPTIYGNGDTIVVKSVSIDVDAAYNGEEGSYIKPAINMVVGGQSRHFDSMSGEGAYSWSGLNESTNNITVSLAETYSDKNAVAVNSLRVIYEKGSATPQSGGAEYTRYGDGSKGTEGKN